MLTALALSPALLQAQDASTYEAKPVLPKLELQDGDSIVFLGDSITHQRLYTQYVEDYFYTRYPHMRLKLHNAGVGGAKAWDALERFDDDVAAYNPKYVTILLGMNDGRYQPFNQEIWDTYRTDMTKLLERLDGIGAKPIPMTPTMFDARAARLFPRKGRDGDNVALYNSVLTYYGTWLREVAVERGDGFVDMWGPLNNITLEQRKQDPAFTMIKDAVHPGPDGQLVMATAIINDLGLSRQVSAIRLTKRGNKWTGNGAGGELTDIEETSDGIAFTFHATALPWVVPEEAAKGVELTKLGHRLGKELLEIHGLPMGQYALTIDGQEVGKFGSEALSRHIELQGNAKTPQYQQALQVALKNKERNEGPIGGLRGEWGRFQGYARIRQAAKDNPNDENLKKQLAEQEQRNEGMAERVAAHNAAAKELEEQIFEMNQPRALRYVLKRVQQPLLQQK
ncbi:MAG: SGNH/GDSL hydrolase family protein [Planctomycetaceae bacterium]|nr:SGNH/GDSL hydrolase family protein [Planctomycetaceae bacterium]